jgi:hypothetical protein
MSYGDPVPRTDLLTSVEAAEILDVTPRSVRRLAISGDLPTAHQLPGKKGAYLFSADVIALIAQQRKGRPRRGRRRAGQRSPATDRENQGS